MLKKLIYVLAFGLLADAFAQTYDLPIMFIDTKQKCLDYKVTKKLPATIKVLDAKTNNVADSSKATQYNIGIKVRGKSSATQPKSNYTIEFYDSTGKDMNVGLLGLPPSDDWALLGPYVDKSMVRNSFGHWLFRQTGRYSPRTKHFDLYINGAYRGVYVLTERIKRGKYRVNVSELQKTDTEGENLTGGYIWEFDKKWSRTGAGEPIDNTIRDFKTSEGHNVVLIYPRKKKITNEQKEYIQNYLGELDSLYKGDKSGSGYEKYVDIVSAADYILHLELTTNADPYFAYNFFMYKPKDETDEHGNKTTGKITLGPPWGFEITLCNNTHPENYEINKEDSTSLPTLENCFVEGWQIDRAYKNIGLGGVQPIRWLLEMWKDSVFQTEMKKRWAELRSGVWHTKTMDAYLDSMKAHLKDAAERNFKRWPNLGKGSSSYEEDPLPIKYCRESQILGTGVPIGGFNADTWDGEFEHLRKKTKERIAWMDEQLGFTEPTNPVVTAPVDPEIHEPHWQKDTIPDDTIPDDTVPPIRLKEFGRLSPTNFFDINGNNIEVQTSLGGTFALIDLNGVVLYKTRIKKGLTILKIPANARNKAWIATLNGKMMNR